MNIIYQNNKVARQCTDLRVAKKNFPNAVAEKLLQLINFIEAAENLVAVIQAPYHFHPLKGDKTGLYALDVAGRKSSYRLIVSFPESSTGDIFLQAMTIVAVQVKEVSKHYE